jgi:hypothetical protein
MVDMPLSLLFEHIQSKTYFFLKNIVLSVFPNLWTTCSSRDVGDILEKVPSSLFFLCVALWLELRAHTLSHPTSPFWEGLFQNRVS